LNQEQGLSDKIDVVDGNFEQLPFADQSYNVAWSQDSFLHSGDRAQILQEVGRILQPQGQLIFTDIMQTDNCPEGVLQPVLDRIHLASLGSVSFYQKAAAKAGLEEVQVIDLTHQLVNHYSRVAAETKSHYDEAVQESGKDYIDRMLVGLQHWVDAGQNGYLFWGIVQFRKA
jgi:sarcosine/dimethylglycine N-methyltransferase